MGVLDGGGDCRKEGEILGVNVGNPIVTNGDFVAYLFSAVMCSDAALPKLLCDSNFLFAFAQYKMYVVLEYLSSFEFQLHHYSALSFS